MNVSSPTSVPASVATGCGSSACQCASPAMPSLACLTNIPVAEPDAYINGIALHAPGQRPELDELREMAYSELLRQQAVVKGLLPRYIGLAAPKLNEAERQVIEAMVDADVHSPLPNDEECQRYYEANPSQFIVGQSLHVRHILFAVTPGINVQALAVHAERALLELSHKSAKPERFVQLAIELSNCPTSAQGGDLGWIGPDDCAPELANELFHQKHAQRGQGVHPQLVHSRFGFHIVDVMARRAGRQPAYGEVRERIAALLAMQSRARALHQYMSLLVGEVDVEGLEGMGLDAAHSPLVQ